MKEVLFAVMALGVLTGCGKKEEAAAPAKSPPQSAMPTVPTHAGNPGEQPPPPPGPDGAPAPQPTTAPADGIDPNLVDEDGKIVALEVLNAKVKEYVKSNSEPPPSLDALVKGRYISRIPAAPNGKRFVYDPKTGSVTLQPL